jgi:trafficking protein particle complex subunit 10
VEYFDPYNIYELLEPGLIPRLPLRNLHWKSHAGPPRSIDTLHVELVPSGGGSESTTGSPALSRSVIASTASTKDDGFQTQIGGKVAASTDTVDAQARTTTTQRRHQIPGLRRTPYLKILLVRCDDNETYKAHTRAEIREWVKTNTPPSQSTRKLNTQENHDAYEWLILHVVIPNTAAASQPRVTKGSETSIADKGPSRWRTSGSSSLLEKLQSDFNGTSKGTADRVAQIRIHVNDVPYHILPKVVPVPGYAESEQDADNAWQELVIKLKSLILSSFDMRVTQYEDDIKEKDAQRVLPGWNFCTFFMLKEGLARGFESVGLVEDALVGYDELSVGLDSVIQEQAVAGDPERHGGALLSYTEDLKKAADKALSTISGRHAGSLDDEEAVDLQTTDPAPGDGFDDITISSSKKPYRDMILANNVSVFDFRCYIFARQISLLLRQGNAWSTREELLAKLKEQQESVLRGVAPRAPAPKQVEESENLAMLAEICRRTLEFIPALSQVMRKDVIAAIGNQGSETDKDIGDTRVLDPVIAVVVDNIVASFAFSVAQQILAQTSTKSLPIPPSTLAPPDGHEPKSSIPEPKTMMHPARSSSLHVRPGSRPPASPGIFPGLGSRRASVPEHDAVAANAQFLKAGLEDLAGRRAELYVLSRNLLEERGKKRGWITGWSQVPTIGHADLGDMEDISLDQPSDAPSDSMSSEDIPFSMAGIDNQLIRTALENQDDFYRLYETLADKAFRHYLVAGQTHAIHASMADLAVLKVYLHDFDAAVDFFYKIVPFFGESGWSLLELSMLILFAQCLRELQRKGEYVTAVLKLLTKAAAAEKDRLRQKSAVRRGSNAEVEYPESSALRGFVECLLEAAKSLSTEVRVPLSHLFTDVRFIGSPRYHAERDSFSLTLRMRSLLVDEIKFETIRLRLAPINTGSMQDIWVDSLAPAIVKPGVNSVTLSCNVSYYLVITFVHD